MRNKLFCLASFSLIPCVFALAQAPGEKSTKAAGKPAQEAPEKPGEKPAGKALVTLGTKATDKPAAEGGLKLGVTTESEKLLDQAITKLEALTQFRTDVRQVTEMLGYRFTADGQYAIAPDFHMLFELKVQLTDTTGTIKEVCDGRMHWRNHKVLDTQELIKTDVKKIREVLDKPQFSKDIRDKLTGQLGFSGIVPMLKGLRDSQKFESHEEDTLDDKPVNVLHGQWREEVINQATFRGQQLSFADLPTRYPFIPNKSTVWIGREDGWLHKVEMESHKKVLGTTTKITVEFLNPQIGVDLPESLFIFEPPSGIRIEDQTDTLYQQLNLILQQTQASGQTKKAGDATPGSTSAADKSKAKSSASPTEPSPKKGIGLQP